MCVDGKLVVLHLMEVTNLDFAKYAFTNYFMQWAIFTSNFITVVCLPVEQIFLISYGICNSLVAFQKLSIVVLDS